MSKKKVFDKPQKVRTTLEEAEVLTRLKDSVEWAIFKRVCNRYIENLRKISFKLDESDPKFSLRHCEFVSQALGIRNSVKFVDKLGEKIKKEVEKEE